MYKGKRMKKRDRSFILLTSLVLIVALGVGATVAYLIVKTKSIENTFAPASVPPTITEEFDNYVKSDVKVKNTGNVDAYIRALINVTWQEVDAQGKATGVIAPIVPVKGTDYSISAPESGWVYHEADGYWYYTESVAPGGFTTELIPEADQLLPNGDYKLVVEIISQTIQSEGTDALGNKPIELAWNVDISDGKVIAPTIVTEEG